MAKSLKKGNTVRCPDCNTKVNLFCGFDSWKFVCPKCKTSSVWYGLTKHAWEMKQKDVKWAITK